MILIADKRDSAIRTPIVQGNGVRFVDGTGVFGEVYGLAIVFEMSLPGAGRKRHRDDGFSIGQKR